jgi:hypothetical protein
MSDENEQHPVPATLDAFQKVFEAILELALIGQISRTEDELLAGITDQIHELHEQFGEREMLVALKSAGKSEDEAALILKEKLQTRLVMQANEDRESDLSAFATQELFDITDDTKAN